MIDGHAIEARVYAEDPAAQFLPSPGRVNRLSVRPAGAVRIDAGPEDGGTVPPDYDPIVAKVIAHAGTRSEAARLLASALRSAEIHGVKTNRDLLVRVLESRAFLAGDTDTRFLERHDLATLAAPLVAGADERLHAVAAALALQAGARASAGALGTLPSGWRNGAPVPQRRELRASDRTLRVAYTLSRGRCETEVDGEPLDGCRLHGCTAETVDLEVDGVRRRYVVAVYGDAVYVNSAIGQCRFQQVSRFSLPETRRARGSLLSPVPGRVTQVLRDEGDAVIEGEALIVIESMKVHHELVATTSGLLARLLTHEGAQIQAGAAVAVIQEEPDIQEEPNEDD
jgi:acetyl/propionyl-CoA carboxylase alpha subunit